MRKKFTAVLIVTLLLAISGCSSAPAGTASGERPPVNLMFATDLHFYAPELIGDFEHFTLEMENGDGKVVQYSPEIAETLMDTVLREKPDALVLGGDLTLNGEYTSHLRLADMLQSVQDAGIPVLVVPGNHDINSLGAFSYADSDSCANIDENGFRELYGAFGINGAISNDKESLSYLYALREDVYLLMLDTCDYDGFGRSTGSLSKESMKWIEKQLKAAKKAGAQVISVSHHNLLQHSPNWDEPFIMHDSAPLVALLERYKVKLNLTGHIHIQHIIQSEAQGGLTEAATGAMSVSPNYYAEVTIGADKSVSYAVKSLDVSGWAKRNGSTDKNLLDFANYSQAFFDTTNRKKIVARLEAQQLSDEEIAQAADFSGLVNRHYFAGTLAQARDEIMAHPSYKLWAEQGGQDFLSSYMNSKLNDMSAVHTSILLQ